VLTSLRVPLAPGCGVLDRRFGDITRLDGHVRPHSRIGIAIGADQMIGAGIQPEDDARLGAVQNLVPIAELILLVGENVEMNA
jgi:Ni,Fe-hydrogenase III small subunit